MGDNKWSHHRKASKKRKQEMIKEHRTEQDYDGYAQRKGKENG